MEEYKLKNRINEALHLRNMKQIELCEKIGVSRSAVSNWISQRWQPKQDALFKMAKVLDVSEMWLAGYDVPIERPQSQTTPENTNNRFISYMNSLNSDQRNALETFLETFTDNEG